MWPQNPGTLSPEPCPPNPEPQQEEEEEGKDPDDEIEEQIQARLECDGDKFRLTEEELGYIGYHYPVWSLGVERYRPLLPGILRYIMDAGTKKEISGVQLFMSALNDVDVKDQWSKKEKENIEGAMRTFTERLFSKSFEERNVRLNRGFIDQHIVCWWVHWADDFNSFISWFSQLEGLRVLAEDFKNSEKSIIEYFSGLESFPDKEPQMSRYKIVGRMLKEVVS